MTFLNDPVSNAFAVGVIAAFLFVLSAVIFMFFAGKRLNGGAIGTTLKEWDHGFMSTHIKATRYTDNIFGIMIGFTFYKNPNRCDDPRLFEFVKGVGGTVIRGGGFPGAEILAKFPSVNSIEDANDWIKQNLPIYNNIAASI